MQKVLLLLLTSIKLWGGVVYEEPPFFIPSYPTIFEILLTDGETPQTASLLFKNSEMEDFQKITMECSEKSCKTVIPKQKPYSKIEYKLIIKLCSGKELKSEKLILNSVSLPEWQRDTQLKDDFINIYGKNRELNGFISERVIFREILQESIEDLTQIDENSLDDNSSWWEFLNFWSSDEESLEIEENEIDENSETIYKEIFTP